MNRNSLAPIPTAPQLSSVAPLPVNTTAPQIPNESGMLGGAPAPPDLSGMSKFGAAVKKYMNAPAAAQAAGQQSGQAANDADPAAKSLSPEVTAGAYGTPPAFGSGSFAGQVQSAMPPPATGGTDV